MRYNVRDGYISELPSIHRVHLSTCFCHLATHWLVDPMCQQRLCHIFQYYISVCLFPFFPFLFFSKKTPLLRNNLGKKHSSSEGIKYRGGQVDPLPISRYEYLTSQRSLSTESRENKSHPFSASHPSSTMSPVGMWELFLYVFPCFFCTRYLVCYFTHLLTYS